MNYLLPFIVVAATVGILFTVVAFLVPNAKRNGAEHRLKHAKTEEQALAEANKLLAKNPRDFVALGFLGDLYAERKDWDKAFSTYETLASITTLPEDTALQANVKAAKVAMELGKTDAANKFLAAAKSIKRDDPQIDCVSGALEFKLGNYEKAVQVLHRALGINPGDPKILRMLGHSCFKLKRIKEAMTYIRNSMEIAPNDKESLFTLAECYMESGQKDQAMRIYSHLRPDEIWGAKACLASGMLNAESLRDEQAVSDFEIGLKHQNLDEEVELELKYNLAAALIRMRDITHAMSYLAQVKALRGDYKDTAELIAKFEELSTNQNLQIFTLAPSADFVALCRKIVMAYFTRASVKITKTAVCRDDWADITAEVSTTKWTNITMFRFVRTQGTIGELVLRDFHSQLKDAKADKGICAGIGTYSDEARRFTESRLIDLFDRSRLLPILNGIDQKPTLPLSAQQQSYQF